MHGSFDFSFIPRMDIKGIFLLQSPTQSLYELDRLLIQNRQCSTKILHFETLQVPRDLEEEFVHTVSDDLDSAVIRVGM